MIRPVRSHDALLADIRASDKRDSSFRLWWLGQSGFLLQWQSVHVLLDPYLSDSLTKKYSQTDKPHVRMTELVIDPALHGVGAKQKTRNARDDEEQGTHGKHGIVGKGRSQPRTAMYEPLIEREGEDLDHGKPWTYCPRNEA